MIREAEASTTVEEDSDCDTDSDASTSEADESDESEAESREAAAPKPRGRPSKAVAKATKVAAKEKKPVVRGGRGMTGTFPLYHFSGICQPPSLHKAGHIGSTVPVRLCLAVIMPVQLALTDIDVGLQHLYKMEFLCLTAF